jgi:UDP-2,3-diacylglucosamine hydrolase
LSDRQSSGAGALQRLPDTVQAVDFVSDLHLNPALPATVATFFGYLQQTRADALVLLGDVFEAWVGDDSLDQAFESACAQALRDFSRHAPLFVMRGNRDFLLGPAFFAATGAHDLCDPTPMRAFGQTVLLSHGDALCLTDTAYQAFRREVRRPTWQQSFLARPLAERLQVAQQMRKASQAHQRAQEPITWADVDPDIAATWLNESKTNVLIHGHTHRPGSDCGPGGWSRHVLSDWDLDHSDRAEVLRWTAAGFCRITPAGAA